MKYIKTYESNDDKFMIIKMHDRDKYFMGYGNRYSYYIVKFISSYNKYLNNKMMFDIKFGFNDIYNYGVMKENMFIIKKEDFDIIYSSKFLYMCRNFLFNELQDTIKYNI